MSSLTTGIGKGLREPVSPYRSVYFFGADLNAVNADNWNAIPTVWDPATLFDLSGMVKGHEVVVALLGLTGTYSGTYNFTFKWYRDRDGALLYRFNWSRSVGAGSWVYCYSYLGYVDWEIKENGAYHVDLIVSGPESFNRTLGFTIRGIPEEIPPAPAPGDFLDPIFSTVWDIADAVHSAYVEVKGWIWPFNLFQYPLYVMYQGFWNLLTPIANFGDWVDDVAAKVSSILSWGTIWSSILSYVPNLINIRDWFYGWVTNVTNTVNSWWSATQVTVKGWISTAVQPFNTMLTAWNNFWNSTWPGWVSSFNSLKSAWDNFWTVTFPTLVSFTWLTTWWNSRLTDVQNLINSAFTARDSLWSGWQEWRGQVSDFFSDPLEWLWSRFTDWFLGSEE